MNFFGCDEMISYDYHGYQQTVCHGFSRQCVLSGSHCPDTYGNTFHWRINNV